MNDDEEIFCQCECGKEWSMDCEPTPLSCEDNAWQMKIGEFGEWTGVWIDCNGNAVDIDD